MAVFCLVKTRPGKEGLVASRLRTLPNLKQLCLIPGEFDLLVVLDYKSNPIDPRREIAEIVTEKVRKVEHIIDTKTIIPIESQSGNDSNPPVATAFAFIQTRPGKARQVLRRLMKLPEILRTHLLFGTADLLAEIHVESVGSLAPQLIAEVVQGKIAQVRDVCDTETLVPLAASTQF